MPGQVFCIALPDQGGFRVFVDWSGDAHPNAPVEVVRIVAGKDPVPLRGAYAPTIPPATGENMLHTTNCSQLFLWDFEAPMNTPVQYQARDDPFGDTAISTPCVLASADPWLIDPVNSCNNIRLAPCKATCPLPDDVVWVGHEQENYPAVSAQFDVIGRRRPIDIHHIRKDALTVLHFATLTCAARDKLLALTAPGTPVYIPEFPEICWPARYLALGDHAVFPLSRDLRRTERVHTLPAVVVDKPAGPVCCVKNTSWCDMCACAATWNDMDALALTGVDVLQGEAVLC